MERLPLLDCQKRLLLECSDLEKKLAYNCSYHVKLTGNLNTSLLHKALEIISRSYETFSLYFCHSEDGSFEQCKADHPRVDLELIELNVSEYKSKDRLLIVTELIHEFEMHDFDLHNKKIPLYRYRVIKLEGYNVFSMLWHHLILDGASVKIFIKKLVALYNLLLKGHDLNGIKFNGHNHVSEMLVHEEASHKNNAACLSYWAERLKNINPRVDIYPIPINKVPANAIGRPHVGGRFRCKLPIDLSNKLRCFLKENDFTLFQFFSSVLIALIYRYTNREDIVLGYAVNLRGDHLKNHLGCYINNLPLRVFITPEMRFYNLLENVKRLRKEDSKYQSVSGLNLIDLIKRQPESNTSELWNISISEITSSPSIFEFENIISENITVEFVNPRSDLLIMFDSNKEIAIEFEYNRSIYSESRINQLKESFMRIIESAVGDSSICLSEISIMSIEMYKKILFEFNDVNEYAYEDGESLLHNLFEKQAAKTPDNIAVILGEREISYGELNALSNALAKNIQMTVWESRGDNDITDNVVGLYVDCGVNAIIGMLAVLKAGAAFMIVDPAFPQTRLRYILRNAGVNFVLVQDEIAGEAKKLSSSLVCIRIDTSTACEEESYKNSRSECKNNNKLAYFIHTSGTTGDPKGVMIEHRSIVNYILWMKHEYKFGTDCRLLQKTALSFDASIWDFFLPLSQGSTLVCFNKKNTLDALFLIEAIEKYKIDVIQFSPSALDSFLTVVKGNYEAKLRSLKVVFCGGEYLEVGIINKFHAVLNARLVNLYGPTEITIAATHWEAVNQRDSGNEIGCSLIGKPITNAHCYILDDNMNLLPPNVIGMLYVGGVGVARNVVISTQSQEFSKSWKSNITSAFIPHDNLYETGDLACWTEEGDIAYHGRKDSQIKIRGIRIEAQEIDMAISKVNGVERSITTCINLPANKYLVSYVKLAEHVENIDTKKIKECLEGLLPKFMIPDSIKTVNYFPLTSTGKINIASLVKDFEVNSTHNPISPRNMTEYELLKFYKLVLKDQRIGVLDSFFDLGGTSLLAMELAALINRNMNIRINVTDIIKFKTVEKISASFISQNKSVENFCDLINLNEGDGDKNLICIHPAGGTVFCYLDFAEQMGRKCNVYGIQFPRIDNNSYNPKSINTIAKDYVRLCIESSLKKNIVLVGWSLGGVIAHEMAVIFKDMGILIDKLILLDSQAPTKNNQSKVRAISREEYTEKLMKFNAVYEGITDNDIDRMHNIYNSLTGLYMRHKPRICKCDTVLVRSFESVGCHAWDNFAGGSLDVVVFDAGHWFFMSQPYVRELASIVSSLI